MPRFSISGLSDRKLLSAIDKLVKNEHLTTLEILVHLNEIERRDLHLKLGCSSIFDYCVNHLGYSRSAAGRRIQVARCIKRFPEMHGLLKKNTLNLTTVALIAPVLTEDNKKELLERVRDRSQDRVEAIVAGYRPPIAFRDRVKPVRVAVPQAIDSELISHPTLQADQSRCGTRSGGSSGQEYAAQSNTHTRCATHGVERAANRTPGYKIKKQLFIQFLASEEFMAKYAEARSLLSNRLAKVSFEKVFEALMDEFIDRHSPAKKSERRAKRTAVSTTRSQKGTSVKGQSRSGSDIMLTSASGSLSHGTCRQSNALCANTTDKLGKTRHIPAKIRDLVFVRDKARCTYVGTNGRRCESTHRLHVDHIVPFARGGTNAKSNLRLLCAKHNNLEAKRVYGTAKIDVHCRHE